MARPRDHHLAHRPGPTEPRHPLPRHSVRPNGVRHQTSPADAAGLFPPPPPPLDQYGRYAPRSFSAERSPPRSTQETWHVFRGKFPPRTPAGISPQLPPPNRPRNTKTGTTTRPAHGTTLALGDQAPGRSHSLAGFPASGTACISGLSLSAQSHHRTFTRPLAHAEHQAHKTHAPHSSAACRRSVLRQTAATMRRLP